MSNNKPTVMKFGGTSVQDAEAFARVAAIVTGELANSPVVVTSAMSKVSRALVAADFFLFWQSILHKRIEFYNKIQI